MERWKDVPDFPDYRVSSKGRVESYKRGQPRMLKPSRTQTGYATVFLRREGIEGKTMPVHRLVADVFLPNVCKHTYDTVDHIDGNRTNNDYTNLRWTTHRINLMNKTYHRESDMAGTVFKNNRDQWVVQYREPDMAPDSRRKVEYFDDEDEAREFANDMFISYKYWLEAETRDKAENCRKCRKRKRRERDSSVTHPASW